jgi:hypothetical protein
MIFSFTGLYWTLRPPCIFSPHKQFTFNITKRCLATSYPVTGLSARMCREQGRTYEISVASTNYIKTWGGGVPEQASAQLSTAIKVTPIPSKSSFPTDVPSHYRQQHYQ